MCVASVGLSNKSNKGTHAFAILSISFNVTVFVKSYLRFFFFLLHCDDDGGFVRASSTVTFYCSLIGFKTRGLPNGSLDILTLS